MIQPKDTVLIRDSRGEEVTRTVQSVNGREVTVYNPVDGERTFNVADIVSNLSGPERAAARNAAEAQSASKSSK